MWARRTWWIRPAQMRFEWSASGWHRRWEVVAEKSQLERWIKILLCGEWKSLQRVFVFCVPAFPRAWNCLTASPCWYLFAARAAKSWPLRGPGELPESGGRILGIKPNGTWKFVFHRAHKKINVRQI